MKKENFITQLNCGIRPLLVVRARCVHKMSDINLLCGLHLNPGDLCAISALLMLNTILLMLIQCII